MQVLQIGEYNIDTYNYQNIAHLLRSSYDLLQFLKEIESSGDNIHVNNHLNEFQHLIDLNIVKVDEKNKLIVINDWRTWKTLKDENQ